jgi:hypothetical protein
MHLDLTSGTPVLAKTRCHLHEDQDGRLCSLQHGIPVLTQRICGRSHCGVFVEQQPLEHAVHQVTMPGFPGTTPFGSFVGRK